MSGLDQSQIDLTRSTSAELAEGTPRSPATRRRERRPSRGLASQVATGFVSAALLIGLWYGLSSVIGSSVLPTPHQTVAAIKKSAEEGHLWLDMGATSKRIVGAFTLAFVVSLVGGLSLGLSKIVSRVFGSWVTVAASIPSLLYLIAAYLTIGLSDRAAMVGVALIVAPSMTFAIWEGVKTLNPELGEMARAFGVRKPIIIRRVMLPQTLPFLFAATRTGLALTWRIMIFAELVGRSSGVGFRIAHWYNLFNMERVLGAALPFVIVMLLFEFVVLRPAERKLFRWRREEYR